MKFIEIRDFLLPHDPEWTGDIISQSIIVRKTDIINEIFTVARVCHSMLELVGVLERFKDVQWLFFCQRDVVGQAGTCLSEPISLTATVETVFIPIYWKRWLKGEIIVFEKHFVGYF